MGPISAPKWVRFTRQSPLFFLADGHGSTWVLADAAGAIANIAGVEQFFFYDAYGNLLNMQATLAATSYLYSGEQFDAKIGQQYLRARFYDASTGRFNRLDDFAGNSQDPQSFHKYAYVNGDPVQMVDPTGLEGLTAQLGSMTVGQILSGMVYGAVTGALIGATIGGAASGYLHVVETRSFDGIGNAIYEGAKAGALWGALIGASAINPQLLAMTVTAALGYNVGQAIQAVFFTDLRWQTKLSIVLLVLVQARLSKTIIQRGIKANTDPNFTTNQQARLGYHAERDAGMKLAKTMRNNGDSPEAIGRAVSELRNQAKVEARSTMKPEQVAELEARNMVEYGNPVGPTADQMYVKYGSWEGVIEASFRTNAYYDLMYLPPGQQILFPGLEEPDVLKNWGNQ